MQTNTYFTGDVPIYNNYATVQNGERMVFIRSQRRPDFYIMSRIYPSTNQFPLYQPDNAKVITLDTLNRSYRNQGKVQLGPRLERTDLPEMETQINRDPIPAPALAPVIAPVLPPALPPRPTLVQPPPPIPDAELIQEDREESEEEEMTEDELHIYLHVEVAFNNNRTNLTTIFDEITNLIDQSLNSHYVDDWRVTTVEANNYEDSHRTLLEQVETVIDDVEVLRRSIKNQ
jgi:hypothetical protein